MVCSRSMLAVVLVGTILFAQERHPVRFSRGGVSLASHPELPSQVSANDTLKVLALRVDFQPDSDTLTSGNGKFQLIRASNRMIDPPPHDSSYFVYKLIFLENYFRKVSRGKVILKGDLFPKAVTLSRTMSAYSPPKDGSDDARLVKLAIESWRAADSLLPTFRFSNYHAFILFHAGVGRDIDLVASLGFDPTPNDIPSLTFTLRGFQEYLKDPSFQGISVSGGTFKITNTLVLPETETRIFVSGLRTDTLQLSINGLLASSFGTFLGLPDLFDTKTGRSGIGRFGLMDGAAIFSYNGLFPPEPSAWEKTFLGWTTPMTVSAGTQQISLPAMGLFPATRDTIYKIPISTREYFLIENRSRDPHSNGQRLTIFENGALSTRFFSNDTAGFRFDDVRGISGSVVDVEDYDWALPGLGGFTDDIVGGGVLIWHIDENIIDREIATNTINANPAKRGVDLEEADGSQDIGQSYDILEAGSGTEFGSPFDFWFSGNPAPPYKNMFDDDSHPNSKSNVGARSLVGVREFGKRSARMSMVVQTGNNKFQRLGQFSRTYAGPIQNVTFPTWSGSTIFTSVNNKIYAFRKDGKPRTIDSTGLLWSKGGRFAPAAFDYDGLKSVLAAVQDSTLYILNLEDNSNSGRFNSIVVVEVPLGRRVTTSPLFADLTIQRFVVVGGEGGTVWQVALDGTVQSRRSVSQSPITSITQLPTPILARPNQLYFASGGRLYAESSSISLGDSSFPWILAAATSPSGNFVVAAQKGGTKVVAFNSTLTEKIFEYAVRRGTILSVIAADIDRDGPKEILILSDSDLYALNRTGREMDGFPITMRTGNSFAGTPLVGDVDGDRRPDIVTVTTSGELVAFDVAGKALGGFPIQISSSGSNFPTFFESASNKVGILALSGSGAMQAIEIAVPMEYESLLWPQYLHDSQHTNSDYAFTANPVSRSNEYLPPSRVYNWPNPVYGHTTQIRYYVPEDAAINVKIFDLTGAKVAELADRAVGGVDGEITWDVKDVQSGVYLARIEATGNVQSRVAIIKIAVVK